MSTEIDPNSVSRAVAAEEVGLDLPEQGSSYVPLLQPGIYAALIPQNVAELVEESVVSDLEGNPRWVATAKFTADNPLVLVASKDPSKPETDWKGYPLSASISSRPRPRGKKGPDQRLVSDFAYLIRESLADKSMIREIGDWKKVLAKYANKVFWFESGATARCRPDAVRYIEVEEEGQVRAIEDPDGIAGCGERYYTRQIPHEVDASGVVTAKLAERFSCLKCGASLRAFAQIDRFLKPGGAR